MGNLLNIRIGANNTVTHQEFTREVSISVMKKLPNQTLSQLAFLGENYMSLLWRRVLNIHQQRVLYGFIFFIHEVENVRF